MTHWTANIDDFVYFVQSDFMAQIALCLEAESTPRKDYAHRLGITPSRVSQLLNDPNNLTVRNIVKFARGIGKKVAIVVYDDLDQANNKGPLNGEIFDRCWQAVGQPRDVFSIETRPGFAAPTSIFGIGESVAFTITAAPPAFVTSRVTQEFYRPKSRVQPSMVHKVIAETPMDLVAAAAYELHNTGTPLWQMKKQ
ncbi:MAG TPA: XRE family transcriptional regulator [Terriglobales bacterium]